MQRGARICLCNKHSGSRSGGARFEKHATCDRRRGSLAIHRSIALFLWAASLALLLAQAREGRGALGTVSSVFPPFGVTPRCTAVGLERAFVSSRCPFLFPRAAGAAQVKVWFQNRRMKWRHSKEAQAQKDKDQKAGEKPAGGAPAADGEQEDRSLSRSEGEAESDSSDSESLDMAPSDTERTEGAERSLHQTTVIKASAASTLLPASSGGSGGGSGSGGGGSFTFSSLSSSSASAGSASNLGSGSGGAPELLPAPQPTVSSAPKSPEPAQPPLGGL